MLKMIKIIKISVLISLCVVFYIFERYLYHSYLLIKESFPSMHLLTIFSFTAFWLLSIFILIFLKALDFFRNLERKTMVKIWTIKEGWFIKWIKDVNEIKINEVISELNLSTGTPNPPGSQYIIGPSQLGKPNLVGIYFEQKKV